MGLSEDERRVGEALRKHFDPDGRKVIFDVVVLMLDIERRREKQIESDNRIEGPKEARPAWTTQMVHDDDERVEAERQRHIEIFGNADARRRYLGQPWVTEREITLAQSIKSVFRAQLPAETCLKDWALIERVAPIYGRPMPRHTIERQRRGKRSDNTERKIAADLGIHHSAVSKMKSCQGRAAEIRSALAPLADAVVPAPILQTAA
jgi:hypothetical protein